MTPMDLYPPTMTPSAVQPGGLYGLCHTNREDLQATEYRHLPCRARGIEETVMTLGGEEESSVSILA